MKNLKGLIVGLVLGLIGTAVAVGPVPIDKLRVGQGTVSSPSIGPADQTSTGWYFLPTGIGVFTDTGVAEHAWGNDTWKQRSTGIIAWSSTSTAVTGSNHDGWLLDASDVVLRRNAAGHLMLGFTSMTNQKFSVTETWTDASNYEFGTISMGSDTMTVGPTTAGTGVDNMSLSLLSAGTGAVSVSGNSTQAGLLRLGEDTDDGSNYAQFSVPALAANTVYTLPSDDGDASQVLTTDGSGVLDWATPAAGGYATVDDEDTPLTQRTTLNFEGAGVTCADDTNQTTCTISGGGSGGKPWEKFTANQAFLPAASYATQDTRNTHPVLDFDAAADECAYFGGFLNGSYAGGGLNVVLAWMATSATTGATGWLVSIEAHPDDALDLDSDSFVADNSASATTASATGEVQYTTVAFTDGADMDSLVAGESYRLRVCRDGDGSVVTDDMAGDAELYKVIVAEP